MRQWYSSTAAVVRSTVREIRRHDFMLLAAGLTLYAGIAIVPVLLLGIYGAGLLSRSG